jgi:hypothetical protein
MSEHQEINQRCPVRGCRTKRRHSDDSSVQASLRLISNPAELARWTKGCIVELINSCIDDLNKGRLFAYLTRWRAPEELYFRLLYIVFIASDAELPHICSGEMPNSLAHMWRQVNEVVLEGRGTLENVQLGLNGEEYTTMRSLNQNAHASFATMITCIALARTPGREAFVLKHIDHWKRLCDYLNYIEEMFAAGKTKPDVLVGVTNLHRPRQIEVTP